MKKSAGFTIIEITVVMTIMAILATLSIFAINAVRSKTLRDKVTTDEANFANKIVALREQQKKTLGQIISPNVCSSTNPANCSTVWQTKLGHSTTPTDPWGTVFRIDIGETSSSCTMDRIISFGPNRTVGGGDDIVFNIPFYSRACAGN